MVASGGKTAEQTAHEWRVNVSVGCSTEPYTLERVGSWGRNEGRISDSESEMVVENLSGEGGRDDCVVASVI